MGGGLRMCHGGNRGVSTRVRGGRGGGWCGGGAACCRAVWWWGSVVMVVGQEGHVSGVMPVTIDGSEHCLRDSVRAPHRGVRWAGLTASAVLLAGLHQSPTWRSEVGA